MVLEVVRYFSGNYRRTFSLEEMAKHLHISLEQIEFSFDRHRGKTVNQSLIDYRLNRLCDQMTARPTESLENLIERCGLMLFRETNRAFEVAFGINLLEYQKQCSLATEARSMRENNHHQNDDEDRIPALALDGIHGPGFQPRKTFATNHSRPGQH